MLQFIALKGRVHEIFLFAFMASLYVQSKDLKTIFFRAPSQSYAIFYTSKVMYAGIVKKEEEGRG